MVLDQCRDVNEVPDATERGDHMNIWPVSNGPDPDIGQPFIIFQAFDTGLVSIYLPTPGPALVTPEAAEHARVRLGTAITTAREQR